jgi:hypothetical protein
MKSRDLVLVALATGCNSGSDRGPPGGAPDAAGGRAGDAAIADGSIPDAMSTPDARAGADATVMIDAASPGIDSAPEVDADQGPLVPVFTRHPANPVLEPHDPDVAYWDHAGIFDPAVVHEPDGSWLMFFAGNDNDGPHYAIGRAVSADGIAWTADLGPLDPLYLAYGPSVLREGDQYRMWFTRFDWENPARILHARSTDGRTWTGASQAIAVGAHPSVIKETVGYRMWFSRGPWTGDGQIYQATSPDGLVWTVEPVPVIDGTHPAVIVDGGVYKMWFERPDQGIFYATSVDGLTWTVHGVSLSPGPAGAWDRQVGSPVVVRDGSVLKMWYTGYSDRPSAIGYATSP